MRRAHGARNDEVGFLLEDYRQAWDHHRHVEDAAPALPDDLLHGHPRAAPPSSAPLIAGEQSVVRPVRSSLPWRRSSRSFQACLVLRLGHDPALRHGAAALLDASMHENRLRRGERARAYPDDDSAHDRRGRRQVRSRPRWLYSLAARGRGHPGRVPPQPAALLAGLTLVHRPLLAQPAAHRRLRRGARRRARRDEPRLRDVCARLAAPPTRSPTTSLPSNLTPCF